MLPAARMSRDESRLVEAALVVQALLLGVEVRPHPGEPFLSAIMGAAAVRRLPGPPANPLAADLALEPAQTQLLLAAVIEAVHRARIREQRHTMRRHCRGDVDQRLLALQH